MVIPLIVAGETLILYPERAVFWEHTATLLIADLHWGKDTAFRTVGIPVPHGSLEDDLNRLDAALRRQPTERLIILGDLLHSRTSLSPETIDRVSAWRRTWDSTEITLVRGNHDRHVRTLPDGWQMREVYEQHEAPFILRHIPEPSEAGYVLSGHLHPAVELRGKGRQIINVPCFWFGTRVGVLPAFGTFTGVSVVEPREGDQVVGVVNNSLLKLST